MSFKVKDLTVVVSGALDDLSTCTGWTKPECLSSIFWQDGAARQHNLTALKTQLRRAISRA